MNMTFGGQVAKVLSVFGFVFVMIIVLHIFMLLLQYTTAGTFNRKKPIETVKNNGTSVFYCSWDTVFCWRRFQLH